MFSSFRLADAWPLGTVAEASESPGDPQDVFLLIGQSNMAGRAPVEELDNAVVEGALLFTGCGWEPLSNPVNRYSTVIVGDPLSRLGPGYTLARKLADVTGRRIGIVSNARGGTSVSQWQKGYAGDRDFDLYEQAVSRARVALEMTPGARLAGIIWHQGEADDSPELAPHYLSRLERLTEDLRADLNVPDAVLIVGEVGMWNGQGAHVNPVLRQVATHIKNAHWVSSADLVPLPLKDGSPNLNDPHFNTLSQRVLGGRYADRVLEVVYGLSPGAVTLYAANELSHGRDFTGYSASLPVGEYDGDALARRGIMLEQISSVRVQAGYEIVFHASQKTLSVREDRTTIRPAEDLEGAVQSVSIRLVP
ncbi:MAG: sialate O-acetylesterase [Limnochordia bacterium]|jgi:hypothetical protein